MEFWLYNSKAQRLVKNNMSNFDKVDDSYKYIWEGKWIKNTRYKGGPWYIITLADILYNPKVLLFIKTSKDLDSLLTQVVQLFKDGYDNPNPEFYHKR